MVDDTASRLGHERRDVNVRAVVWFAVGLVITAAIMHIAVGVLFVVFKKEHPSPEAPSRTVLRPRVLAPEPRLQTNPTADLEQFQAQQQAKLNSYGWIDKPAGIIHIPIGRAMDLLAQRGLPTRGPGTQDASGKTPEQMRQEKAVNRR